MKTVISIVLVFLPLFFNGCESKPQKAKTSEYEVKTQTKLPKFTLTTTNNETINLTISRDTLFSKQLQNKIVLVNFWAPWCEPCKKEMPSFVKLQEKYKNDFVILGVLFDKETTKEDLDNFLKEYKVNFPITVGEENFNLAKVFDDVKMIPESFLYTKDGIFIEKFIGEISENKLETYIKNNL
jgi:thiol-disulfide isomerase/thioredoxin